MKKISVIIPAFNHAEYIGEAIKSVQDSDYSNIEIIVIDDGSIDRTSEVVSSFRNVKYFHQENSGAHAAINNGISLASGDLVAVLNDDDKYTINHLTAAVSNMEVYGNSFFIGAPIVFGHGWKLDALKGHIYQSQIAVENLGLGKSLFQINWSISTSSFVFKKDLFVKLGGFHNFTMCHDLDFLLRALLVAGVKVGVSEVPTWFYRCHETNSGSSISSKKQAAEIIYSLGRVLDPILEKFSSESLLQTIGYGLDPKIILEASIVKPWVAEVHLGVEKSINEWVALYS
jgi:glycosyltransferase involved in cell wall biosynthesis